MQIVLSHKAAGTLALQRGVTQADILQHGMARMNDCRQVGRTGHQKEAIQEDIPFLEMPQEAHEAFRMPGFHQEVVQVADLHREKTQAAILWYEVTQEKEYEEAQVEFPQ